MNFVIGLDFGTDSVRAVLVNCSNGNTVSTRVHWYQRWKQGKYCEPSHLISIDPSEGFLARAKERLQNKGNFLVGSATDLPLKENSIDIVVSGLTLNFFPDLESALAEMKRVSKPNGTIAAYVWDYSGKFNNDETPRIVLNKMIELGLIKRVGKGIYKVLLKF